MTAFNQDFEMVAGDAKNLTFTLTDDDGDPLDVSSGTLRWGFAKDIRKDEPLVLKSSGDGIAVSGAGNNVVSVTLEKDDTRGYKGLYGHELEWDEAGSGPTTLAQGQVTFKPELIKT
jgi:hypothetical protein